jgi:uncharacterized protein YqgQ
MKIAFWFILISLFCNLQLFAQNISPYKFEPGFYRIIDYPINIRSEPGLHGNIIGRLSLHDEIEIIENTNRMDYFETYYDYWYKIRFNNIFGYIWGGYIAAKYFETDIDNNGQKDFIYIRFIIKTGIWQGTSNYYEVKSHGDGGIIIYFNNRKININLINETLTSLWSRDEFYYAGAIIKYNNEYYLMYVNELDNRIFKINKNGSIDYLGPSGHVTESALLKYGIFHYF